MVFIFVHSINWITDASESEWEMMLATVFALLTKYAECDVYSLFKLATLSSFFFQLIKTSFWYIISRAIHYTIPIFILVMPNIKIHLFKYLHLLCIIFGRQAGGRKLLLDVIPMVWKDTSVLIKSSAATQSPLLRKYLVKLTQRIGLTCLPHRSPSWRYVVSHAEDIIILILNLIVSLGGLSFLGI